MQIHAQNHMPTHVRSGECLDRTASDKAMRSRMDGEAIENLGENPALDLFEMRFRLLNEPQAAGSLGQCSVVIVRQFGASSLLIKLRLKSFQVGEPLQLRFAEMQP